ncbi:MAG: hypothetical protein K2X99_02035 [Gemmatimonadaceae bacterium]|nr:hypothetical protein [Gemmatimonadaceae bacterium]
MLFTSWPFVGFVVVVASLYYAPGVRRAQLPLLVVASVGLYAWLVGPMAWLLVLAGVITTVTSAQVSATEMHTRRRAWAVVGVAANLAVLVWFKYARLFAPMLPAASTIGSWATLPIPAGLSFFTFHGISLVVDVWRGAWTPPRGARHSMQSAFYLTFFPQLVAGPIVRARDVLPQVAPKAFTAIAWPTVRRALIVGAYLKLVVADHLVAYTLGMDGAVAAGLPGVNLAAMLVAYAAQLFADFAAYSSIAIGLAALFGYTLPRNFAYPYLACSLRDFWRRWHISLGTWLRDYLYLPLGGDRRGRARTAINLILVVTLAGLWHGAAWGFALWGAWSGVGLVVERALSRASWSDSRSGQLLRWLAVITYVTIGWLFFRLGDVAAALTYLRAIVARSAAAPDVFSLLSIAWFLLPVVLYHWWGALRESHPARRPAVVDALLGVLIAWTVLDAAPPTPFIYFQF